MQARWLISLVLLAVLGTALVANAQTTNTPGSSDPPQNFTVVRVVGSASDAASDLNASTVNALSNNVNNFGSQAQIWFAFWNPQNLGNDPTSAVRDYGVTISPATNVSTQTCTQISGAVCANAPVASSTGITTTNQLMAIHWFDQQIVEGTPYTLASYSVSNFGPGVSGNSQTQTIPYSGNPIRPSTPSFTFIAPTSFVINFSPPQYIGQRGNGPNTGGGNQFVLTQLNNSVYEVQIRYPALSTADTAYPQWYSVVNNANVQFQGVGTSAVSTAGASNLSGVVESYTTTSATAYLLANAAYQVRVRAIGQWGRGVWSAAGSVTTANTKATPNAIALAPQAVTTMAAGGLFYWSSALAGHAGTGTGFTGSVGGKGGNSAGAAIASFSVQFSVNSVGTGSLTTATDALSTYFAWNSVTDSVTNLTQQGRVAGGWVSITSASIPAALTTYTTNGANAGTNIYLRVIAANDNGAGTLPGSGVWYNADIQAAAVANMPTPTIYSCWGVIGTPNKTTCSFTIQPPTAIGTAVTFGGYRFTAGSSANPFGTPSPALPTTLGTTSMRWDLGFNTNDFSAAPTAVTAYVDYGVFTTTASYCSKDGLANSNPTFGYAYTPSGGASTNKDLAADTPDFNNAAKAVTTTDNCAATLAGAPTFLTKNAATGNTLGSRFGIAAAAANSQLLAVGVDWVMMWVARPQNAGTNATTAGSLTGWTLRAAKGAGNTDVLASNTAAATPTYYTGISSSGAYTTSTSSSINTDLNFVVAAKFAADAFNGIAVADATAFQAVAGSCFTVSNWAMDDASPTVTKVASTSNLAVGQRLTTNIAKFPADAGGVYIGEIEANTSFKVVQSDLKTAVNSTGEITQNAANVVMACNALAYGTTTAFTAGSVFTADATAANLGSPGAMAVLDVSDYSAAVVFSYKMDANAAINGRSSVALGGTWNSGAPAFAYTFTTSTFGVPNGTAVNTATLTCTSLDNSQQIGAQLLNFCSIPLTMPGRQYTLTAKLTVGGVTSNTAIAVGANTTFWASSERPSNPGTASAVAGTTAPKNSYYYATATQFLLFRSVQFNASIGQGGYNSRAYNDASSNTTTPWRAYVAWGTPTAVGSTATRTQRDEALTAAVAAVGNYHQLTVTQWKGVAFNTGINAGLLVAYSINVSIRTDINQAVPPTAQSVITGTTTTATYSSAPTLLTSSANVRRLTTTSAWIEFEAPQTQNLSTAAWFIAYTCGSTTGNTAGSPAATNSNTVGYNFLLVNADVGAGNAGASCAFTVQLGDNTTKGTASGSVTIQLSKTTGGVTGAPLTPIFDQITSGSAVIVVPWPVDLGNSANSVSTLASANVVVTLTSGTTNTGNAIFDTTGNGAVANTSTTYQDIAAYTSGFAARITGFQPATGSSVNIAANSAYSVVVTLSNGAGASNISASTTATFTSNRNGDIPLAPTVTNISRITSATVRLTVTRPINVGGSPLASLFGQATAGITFRAWGFENGSGNTGLSPLSISISNPIIQWYTPVQANVIGYIIDVSGGISLSTSGRNYVFYVNADNQFSSAVTGNYVAGTSALVNLSAATVATAMPAASGINPGAALSPTITSISDTAISFIWSENTLFGSTAITGYKISRRTGGTGAYTSLSTVNFGSALFVQDTALTAGTAYDYNIVATNGGDATAANVATTTLAANAAPGAPATPQILNYADSRVRVYWSQPVSIGGLQGTFAAPQLSGYRLTTTWASSVQAEVCDFVFSWVGATAVTTGIATTTDLNTVPYFYYTVSGVIQPGKSYSFRVLATNVITPTGGVPTTQLGANSPSVTQLANSVARPFPLPTITANVVGAGYATFTVGSQGTYSTTGTSFTGFDSSFLGYQILQMSPNTNQTGSTFVADRIWDFTSFGSFFAGVVTSNLYANELMANSRYRFKVQYTNGYQTAVQANDITVTTATTAVVPGSINSVASDLLAKRSNSITLGWVSPLETGGRGALTQFRVTYVASSSTNVQVNTTAPAIAYNAFGFRAFSMRLGGLAAATQYTIQVFGINSVGTSTAASSFAGTPSTTNGLNNLVTTGQVPNLPTNLAVVTNNNSPKLTLSWTTSVAGSTVSTTQQFNIQNTADNGAAASAAVSAITTTQVDVSGVVAGGLYRFQLSTTNSLGTGEQSAALFVQVTPTTSTTAAPIPAQIGVPTLNGYSSDEYRLSWNADSAVTNAFNSANPTVNPGAAYVVAYWSISNRFYATSTVPLMNQGGNLMTAMLGPGSSTSGASPSFLATCTQLVSGIRPSSQYMVTVAGKNSPVNWGAFSAFGYNTAGNPIGFRPQMTQPATAGAPQSVQLQNGNASITTNSFAVQWTGPTWIGQSGITQYRITLSQEFGSRLIVTNLNNPNTTTNTRQTQPSAVQYTATGLQSATNYIINIRAVNSFGPSIPSQNLRVTTNSSSGFAAQTSFWTVVLMALAAVLAFAF